MKEFAEYEKQEKRKKEKFEINPETYDENDPEVKILRTREKTQEIIENNEIEIEEAKKEKPETRPITAKKNKFFTNDTEFSTIQKGVQTEQKENKTESNLQIKNADINNMFNQPTNLFNKPNISRPMTSRSKILHMNKNEVPPLVVKIN